MQAKAAIGVDVGGTRVKAVVVEDEGTVLDQVVRPSLDDGVARWAGDVHRRHLDRGGRQLYGQ